jgi:hypothetical protein
MGQGSRLVQVSCADGRSFIDSGKRRSVTSRPIMFEHDPAHGSMPFAERNEAAETSSTALPWYLICTKFGKEQYHLHRQLSRRLPETLCRCLRREGGRSAPARAAQTGDRHTRTAGIAVRCARRWPPLPHQPAPVAGAPSHRPGRVTCASRPYRVDI